jgi:hypothetical protein
LTILNKTAPVCESCPVGPNITVSFAILREGRRLKCLADINSLDNFTSNGKIVEQGLFVACRDLVKQ